MLGLGRARVNREHRFASKNLSAYIDGELTAKERSRVERHLAACAECRRDVETLQATVGLLRHVPLKPVPRSFALPASARAVQARHRRWNGAFTAMRAATVTIATMLVLVFAGDAALSSGLVSLPTGRTVREQVVLSAPDQGQPLVNEGEPTTAEAAPQAAPQVMVEPESEGEAESYAAGETAAAETAGAEAAPVGEAPATETARALQPPRETWPGPDAQSKGAEGGGGEGGGLGGAGGGAGDMGGTDLPLPRPNGAGGAEPPGDEPEAEAVAEALEAPAEEPQPEMMVAPEPTTTPTPGPEPTQPPPAPTAEAAAPPPAAAPRAGDTVTAEETSVPEALAVPVAPEDARADEGEPEGEAERVMPLDRQPESPWWQAWRSLRLLVGLLTGMLLIALAGTIWTGYKRGSL